MKVWKLFAGASLLGAGALAIACSSSSSSGGPPAGDDAGDGSTATDDGGGDAACVKNAMSIATLDGGSMWGCVQTTCDSMGLSACAADCVCNNAIVASLACIQAKGATITGSQTMACFTTNLGGVATETAVAGFIPCLTKAGMSCAGIGVEGGTEGGSGDAGDGGGSTTSDAGDGGGSTTSDASDGGGSDAGASDAPAG